MASLTRSPVAALVSLALILVLGLGLGLGLGVGLATSDASACKALADAVAANLDARLEDKDTFALALASAEMPGLVVVGASPASADEAACEQATPAVNVRVAFSLDGAVEGIVSSEKKQEKLHDAVALAMGVTSQDLAISVTPGSLNVEAKMKLMQCASIAGLGAGGLGHGFLLYWGLCLAREPFSWA